MGTHLTADCLYKLNSSAFVIKTSCPLASGVEMVSKHCIEDPGLDDLIMFASTEELQYSIAIIENTRDRVGSNSRRKEGPDGGIVYD